MGITVLLEAQARPGMATQFHLFLARHLPDTRTYQGCSAAKAHQNMDDDHNFSIIEQWGNRAQYEAYLAWRVETGVLAQAGELLVAPPDIRYFNATDA